MTEQTERRSPEDILEAEAGGPLHQAMIAQEAQAACEIAYENFRYDGEFPADVLAAMKVVAEAQVTV